MKMKELRDKTENELVQLLQEQVTAVREMRFRAALRELKNVRDLRKARTVVARIHLILAERKKHVHTKG